MAWRASHKTECRQLAAARRQQLITERLGTGSDRIERFLTKLGAAALYREIPTPSDLELLHAIQQNIKPLVSSHPPSMRDYVRILSLQVILTGVVDSCIPLDRPRAELLLKEVRWLLEEHSGMVMRMMPNWYLSLVKMGVQVLQRLGRRGEAAALGVQQIPDLEALIAMGTQELRRKVADFFLDLSEDMDEGPEEGKDGEEAQGAGTDEAQRAWGDQIDGKHREEVEGLAKRALAVAEGAGVDEQKVRIP